MATFSTGAPFTPFASDLLVPFIARYGADPLGVTVARIRGNMAMYVSTGAAIQSGRIGIRVGTEGEVASTEFNPDTLGEYSDWMAFEPFLLLPIVVSQVPMAFTELAGRKVDVKSNRKIDELDQTLFLYAGSRGVTAQTVTIYFDLSIGLLLP